MTGVGEMERKGITCNWTSSSSQALGTTLRLSLFSGSSSNPQCYAEHVQGRLRRTRNSIENSIEFQQKSMRSLSAIGVMRGCMMHGDLSFLRRASPTRQRELACVQPHPTHLPSLRSQSECIAVSNPALANGFSHCTTPSLGCLCGPLPCFS